MAATDVISGVNQKLVGTVTNIKWANILGWIALAILVTGVVWWATGAYRNKKVFSKRITAFEIIGGYWQPAIRDLAKVVKIGKGGFEILYLQKMKAWKIAYGGRVGRNDYYFFIMPDGYWYNGMLFANLNSMDAKGGLIPIVTTNPLMRGQYTSLEKQIDSLAGEGSKFWDKYGGWILSMVFVLIAGVMLWLNYKEYVTATANLKAMASQFADLTKSMANIASNIQGANGGSGLVPIK